MAAKPVYPKPEQILIYTGRVFRAEWYYATTGNMPALEYYESLSDRDKDRFGDIIRYFCDQPLGRPVPRSMYRIEDSENKIYAFKPNSQRFFNFTTSDAAGILTNAYRKHSQQMTKKDIEIRNVAARYRQDFLERIRRGDYYE